jgi:hypothetical protein
MRCLSLQVEWGIMLSCDECISNNKTYTLLELSMSGSYAVVMDTNGRLSRVSIDRVTMLKDGDLNENV